ncbi:MAG: SPASM domain-containing protein [Spirochaetales bacterium]|nr:SPASM domain-containing protein [Spirochaetales bacterium]
MFTATHEIRIETSTLCNYHCIVCPRDRFVRKREVMSNELFDSILEKTIADLPHIEHLTISGFGEFATDKSWKYKIEKGASLFKKVHIITNLSLFDFQDLEFLLRHVSDIRISLYGLSEEVYRKIHRPPHDKQYDELKEKVLFLIDKKKPGQKILLNYIDIPENNHQTGKWINFWKDKADLVEVWRPHNWIDGKAYRLTCAHRVPTCGRPHKGPVQVQADGTVNVCCFDYNGELVIGDLKTMSFSEVFNSAGMEKIQKYHKEGKADELPQCRVCDQRNCQDCKSEQMLFNSKFDREQRVNLTSTEYENLS